MKLIFTSTLFLFLTFMILAQAPQTFNYQAVLRDDSGQPMASAEATIEVEILAGEAVTADMEVVFTETHQVTTNEHGLVNLHVGSVNSTDDIYWGASPFFIRISVDGTEMGTSQLLSVPYALHAQTSADTFSGNYEDLSNTPDLSGFIHAENPQEGDMLFYWEDDWQPLPVGNEGEVLSVENGMPQWKPLPEGDNGDNGDNDDTFTCGDEISFTYQGDTVTYGTVEGQNGTCWMDRNLGASRAATSVDDSQAFGDMFQWGRLDDGHQNRSSGTTTNLSSSDVPGHEDFILPPDSPRDWRSPQNDDLWQGGDDAINNPCPQGWRIPTEDEFDAERSSWDSSNMFGAFASPLKLTAGGDRGFLTGSIGGTGDHGDYWTSDISGTGARSLQVNDVSAAFWFSLRAMGLSVRCIQD